MPVLVGTVLIASNHRRHFSSEDGFVGTLAADDLVVGKILLLSSSHILVQESEEDSLAVSAGLGPGTDQRGDIE